MNNIIKIGTNKGRVVLNGMNNRVIVGDGRTGRIDDLGINNRIEGSHSNAPHPQSATTSHNHPRSTGGMVVTVRDGRVNKFLVDARGVIVQESEESYDTEEDESYEDESYEDESNEEYIIFDKETINLFQAMKIKNAAGDCSICLEKIDPTKKSKRITNLECLHWFHYDCIKKWLKAQDTCPTCRHKVEVVIEQQLR